MKKRQDVLLSILKNSATAQSSKVSHRHCEAEQSKAEAILKRDCFVGLRPSRNDKTLLVAELLQNSRISEFEREVYKAVLAIPKGQVRSYKWVAAAIRRPRASRAVGNALNKNPYPGIVPCHRVVRSDGSIGGYSKGVPLKKGILEREGVDLSPTGLL